MYLYGEREILHLSRRDARLGDAIARIGQIHRETDPDVFASLVRQIVGQQISNAAFETVIARLTERAGSLTPDAILALDADGVQACGMSMRKAMNIVNLAEKVISGEIDPDALRQLPDEQIIAALTALPGVGVWTAEMMLIFCFERPDVLSFGDFGIRRGICMLYGEDALTKAKFNEYRARYSPYATVVGFYLWEIAAGRLKENAP